MHRRSCFKSELAYDNGSFFARLDGQYADERYYTYLNQGSVEAYTLLNRARLPLLELGMLEELSCRCE